MMRIDKFVSSQKAELSRSMVKELCKKGLVTVNGAVCKKSDAKIDPENAQVCIDGELITYRKHIYIFYSAFNYFGFKILKKPAHKYIHRLL